MLVLVGHTGLGLRGTGRWTGGGVRCRVNCKQYGGPGWGAGPTGPASSHTTRGRLHVTTMVTVLLCVVTSLCYWTVLLRVVSCYWT